MHNIYIYGYRASENLRTIQCIPGTAEWLHRIGSLQGSRHRRASQSAQHSRYQGFWERQWIAMIGHDMFYCWVDEKTWCFIAEWMRRRCQVDFPISGICCIHCAEFCSESLLCSTPIAFTLQWSAYAQGNSSSRLSCTSFTSACSSYIHRTLHQ